MLWQTIKLICEKHSSMKTTIEKKKQKLKIREWRERKWTMKCQTLSKNHDNLIEEVNREKNRRISRWKLYFAIFIWTFHSYPDKARNCSTISLQCLMSVFSYCKSYLRTTVGSMAMGGLPWRSRIVGNWALVRRAWPARVSADALLVEMKRTKINSIRNDLVRSKLKIWQTLWI